MNGGEKDLNTALAALNDVDAADVQLLSSFERIFDYDNKGNKEILMANNFQQFESGATFMANMYIDAFPPSSDPQAVAIIGALGGGGGSYWTLTDETRNKFKPGDSRKEATFIELYTREQSTGSYTRYFGSIQRKFNGFVNAGSRLFIDDVVLYRYADVLFKYLFPLSLNILSTEPKVVQNPGYK